MQNLSLIERIRAMRNDLNVLFSDVEALARSSSDDWAQASLLIDEAEQALESAQRQVAYAERAEDDE
jgi:ElaB/YqjD/DUF883 family membrane-anchored ribosome-binding protein